MLCNRLEKALNPTVFDFSPSMATFEGITLLNEDNFSKTFKVDVSGRSITTTVTEYSVSIRPWLLKFKYAGVMRIAVLTKMVRRRYKRPKVVVCTFFINDECLVVSLANRNDIPDVITEFLLDASVLSFVFAGIGIRESIELLLKGRVLDGLEGTFPTTVDLVGRCNNPGCSDLESLSVNVLGYGPVYPPNVESNWRRSLSDHQVAAATIDGAVIFALDQALLARPPV